MLNNGGTEDAALGVMGGSPHRQIAGRGSPWLVGEAAAGGICYAAVDAWQR